MSYATSCDSYAEFDDHFRYARDYWGNFVAFGDQCTRMAAGQAWTDEELQELKDEGREALNLNITRRPMQFFSGYLRDNLNSNVFTSVEKQDAKTADQITKVVDYVWDRGKFYTSLMDGADEAGKAGMSLIGLEMDYSRDVVDGELVGYFRTYNTFYLDPLFTRIDLKDCGFAITRDLIPRNGVERLLAYIDDGPTLQREIPTTFAQEKFRESNPNLYGIRQRKNIVAYDQHYVKVSKKRKYLIDEKSGFFKDVTDEDMDLIKTGINRLQQMKENGEDVGSVPKLRDIWRDKVELRVFLNGVEFYRGVDKTGIDDHFPFAPSLCYFEPSIYNPVLRVQGYPASLWSDQRQFNKRHMKIIAQMDSDISTGFMYLIGAVPNPDDLKQVGTTKLIGVTPEDNPEGLNAVREIKGGNANPALYEYQKILDDLSLTLLNVNESILGIDQDSKSIISGRLAEVRIAQGLRINRKYFDKVEETQEQLAKLTLIGIQKNYSEAKIERILGEAPTEDFFDEDFEKYKIEIKQGIKTKSQMDAAYSEFVNLKREGIIDLPPSFIMQHLNITGMSDVQEYLEEQEKQAEEQKKKVNEQELTEMRLANATTEERLGLAIERRSRVDSNEARKQYQLAKADTELTEAQLNIAKTVSEIEDIEDQRVLRLFDKLREMKTDNAERRESASEVDAIDAETQVDQNMREYEDSAATATEEEAGEIPLE